MKLVIGAAGRGTRFKELTRDLPKHLLPINGQPFLKYILDNAISAGFSEIIIIVGYQAEKIQEFIAQQQFSVPIKLVDQIEKLGSEKYGTACLVECVQDIIGQENFTLMHGDTLFSATDLKQIQINDDLNYLAGYKHAQPEQYGVLIKEQQNNLIQIKEKPTEFVGDLINVALYKFTPEIFIAVKQIKKSPRGEYELTEAINLLAQQQKVKVVQLKDYWLDLGQPEDIPIIEKFLCAKK